MLFIPSYQLLYNKDSKFGFDDKLNFFVPIVFSKEILCKRKYQIVITFFFPFKIFKDFFVYLKYNICNLFIDKILMIILFVSL